MALKNDSAKLFSSGVPVEVINRLLSLPLPVESLNCRPGNTIYVEDDEKWGKARLGQVMVYFDRAHAQAELDKRLGPQNWSVQFTPIEHKEMLDPITKVTKCSATVKCTLTVKTTTGTLIREDFGEQEIQLVLEGQPAQEGNKDYKYVKFEKQQFNANGDPLLKLSNIRRKSPGQSDVTKSAASDAFRRACAALGLGRQYYMPSKEVYHPVSNWGGFLFGKQDGKEYGSKQELLGRLGYTLKQETIDAQIDTILDEISQTAAKK